MLTRKRAIEIFDTLPTLEQIACAIYCVYPLYCSDNNVWRVWADAWLKGERSVTTLLQDAERTSWADSDVNSSEAWCVTLSARGLVEETAHAASHYACRVVDRDIALPEVLTKHFICPHCYSLPNQHIESGKCLFSAHTWEGINNVWRP